MSRLEILTVHDTGGASTLALRGELDIHSSEKLACQLARVEQRKPEVLILDLRELEFIDSSGLRAIVAADSGARGEGRRLVLVEGPELIQRIFRTTLLDHRLNFVEDPVDARSA